MDQDYMDSLNERQREAVTATEGRIRVVAGAGSGKTKALTCRYAYLVNELGIDPANILCLTFTNKAAQEMRQRIHHLVPSGDYNDFVCTIHGFCVKFLRQEIHRLGYPKSFTILDETDAKQLAKQVMEARLAPVNAAAMAASGRKVSQRGMETVAQFLDAVADWKVRHFITQPNYIDRCMVPAGLSTAPDDPSPVETDDSDDAHAYCALQLKNLSLDFQDLIFFTIHILKRFPDACAYWQNEMEYIMLDEAQDCNKSDWTIVETLQGVHHNLFIVGDPDQAIYEWRGARPKMFIDFQDDQTIVLDQNYRSTSPILSVANSVISRNRNRLPKDLFTTRSGGTQVTHFHGRSDSEEARWVAGKIKALTGGSTADGRTVTWSDFAVLYRAGYLSRSIEQALVNAGIDYVIWGGVRFFDRAEIKDAVSYLRLIDHDDDIAFARICNVPSRKVGKTYLAKLRTVADKEGLTLYAALKQHIAQKELYKETMVHFIDLIEKCRQFVDDRQQLPVLLDEHGTVISTQRRDHVISAVLDLVLEDSGYKQLLREDEDTERLENLNELLQSVHNYEEVHAQDDVLSISGYLQEIALYTNMDLDSDGKTSDDATDPATASAMTSPQTKKPARPKVRLMTIHQSKGLEFPYVFVTGLSEGIFPSMKTLRERKGDGEEEERRLMYVAVTRAERELFLTESEGFNAAARLSKYPSRFLREIKRSLFVTEGDMDDMLWQQSKKLITDMGLDFSSTSDNADAASDGPDDAADILTPGTHVMHKVLGEGIVISYNEVRGSYSVEFEGGVRNIRKQFLTRSR